MPAVRGASDALARLSLKQPTEIVRYRFADQPDPYVHMKGYITAYPTLGEPDGEESVQLSIGAFKLMIDGTMRLVDQFRGLPRVVG